MNILCKSGFHKWIKKWGGADTTTTDYIYFTYKCERCGKTK